jgi:DNA topoisomerase-1
VTDRPSRLVIVESPAKAKTIAGYLGDGWHVEASVGHVRDLVEKASEIPATLSAADKARFKDPLGVDVQAGYEPLYRVDARSKPTITKIRQALKAADELYLATDEDREGEAIAWHLLQILKPKVPVRRMVFHEITPEAIARAVDETRDLNLELVEAQETRRIVDRLYGYPVSQVLWRKMTTGLSAGRVQSVATRLLVDRERARIAFRAASYWDLQATLDTERETDDPRTFGARLVSVDRRPVATGKDFDALGQLRSEAADGPVVLDEATVAGMVAALPAAPTVVATVRERPYRSSPKAPFRTTTLQQEASRKLGFTSSRTMQVAQGLYQEGYITYMRTDSTTLSDVAVTAARRQVETLYGREFLPSRPRTYASKVKNAQEAHEAIRPAGDSFRTPAETGLTSDAFRLYELIWKRTVASQMADAVGEAVTVLSEATLPDGQVLGLTASGLVITFPGYRRAYVEGLDDPEAELDAAERPLPAMTVGQPLRVRSATPDGHETKPPPRFTEATLIAELERLEIGRPSTYATIITKVLRSYAEKRGSAIVPSWVAFAVTRLLEEHFPSLVDYAFTAKMEDRLDEIASGRDDRVRALDDFWAGEGDYPGLARLLADAVPAIDARAVSTFPIAEADGSESGLAVRVGRFGPSVEAADGARADLPPGLAPDELTADVARDLLARKAEGDRVLGTHPETGLPIEVKVGRYGPYVQEMLPPDAPPKTKPRTSSLLSTMTPTEVTLEDALRLLSLPRTVGTAPDGEEIVALNGRFGPYLRKGEDSRSLETEEAMFTVGLEEALALFAQPRQRRGARGASAGIPLGDDPETGAPIQRKDGRFGPYVTDGTTNVTIPRGTDPESVTLELAAQLLSAKRAAGPAPARRGAAKKPAAKKSAGKKPAAKKTAAKKPAAKTTAAKQPAAKKPTATKPAATTATDPSTAAPALPAPSPTP